MMARVLKLILGVIFFICSTPGGMARKDIPVDARASFFESCELTQDDGQKNAFDENSFSQNDEAALFDGEETSPQNFQGSEKQQKRHGKRHNRPASAKSFAKTLGNNSLSFNSVEKGYPRSGVKADARRQRTEMIRCLHLEADFV